MRMDQTAAGIHNTEVELRRWQPEKEDVASLRYAFGIKQSQLSSTRDVPIDRKVAQFVAFEIVRNLSGLLKCTKHYPHAVQPRLRIASMQSKRAAHQFCCRVGNLTASAVQLELVG